MAFIFNNERMKDKSNKFWDAYFKMLDLKNQDIGKRIEEVPILREVDIDENYFLRVGRNGAKWDLVDREMDVEICESCQIDIATRAWPLLTTYLDSSVYDSE